MKQFIFYSSIAIFSIFIGSQITEGALLVPYWQSLSATEFYGYYQQFGPSIGRFYTILTIVAAVIPIATAVYSKSRNSLALRPAFISSFLAVAFIACFYIYFKGTNAMFYESTYTESELKTELVTWAYWHWGRILIEFASLIFLMMALIRLDSK